MNRVAAAVVSIGLVAATLSPLARDPADDGYPLSTYPMFSWKRPTALTMSYPVGVTATGRRFLAPELIGTGEVLQARAIVERAVARGPAEARVLCTKIAASVARAPRFADVTRVRIVTGNHDAIGFLVDHERGVEYERASCEVRR